MVQCKKCTSTLIVKNGRVRDLPRYKCKECGLNFVEGDRRIKQSTVVKKALCVVLYSLCKASFNMMGKVFGHSRSLIYRWIVAEMAKFPEPTVSDDITEMEFDEMWHFIRLKKTSYGSSRRWIVAQGELLPGLQAIVMLLPSSDFMTKSNT
jgi:hypothetical protein